MDNPAIARRFYRLAALMDIRGDDPFRLRSYRNAAEAIETWPTPMQKIAAENGIAGLQSIPGVGKAIAGKILELLDRGTFDAWERIIKETPEGVLDLLDIPGIGPKTAAMLHQKYKVSSLEALREFVQNGGLELVDGIGPKTAERIKESLKTD
ncbi:MAG TPA: helix-hairpin-helix domain-containing protein [Pyrinomonadaceae bacterium]|nr:helix-hairpin-helix domain-containing protein [Pyrinomonadaceae bacterium]